MKKILIIVGIIAILGLAYWYFMKQYQAPTATQTTPSQTQPVVVPNTININNFSFTPDQITVKVGTTVTWINFDSVQHTVVSSLFTSPVLAQGDSFTYTFKSSGTVNYNCSIHPTMTGQVVVR